MEEGYCDGCWEETQFAIKITNAYKILPDLESVYELCGSCASKIPSAVKI